MGARRDDRAHVQDAGMTPGDLILGAVIGTASAVVVSLLLLAGMRLFRRRGALRRQAHGREARSDALSAHEHRALLRGGALTIAASVAMAVLVATAVSGALPRQWTASAILYVGQSLTEPSFDHGGLLASQLLTPTYARLATARELLDAVAEELGLDEDPDSLAQRVVADAPAGATLITISGTARSPSEAVELTNAVAEELLRRAPAEREDQGALQQASEEIDAEIAATRETLLELLGKPTLTSEEETTAAQLQQRLDALLSARASLSEELATRSPSALTLVDRARTPNSPASPSRSLIGGVAGLTSSAMAMLLVYAFSGMGNSSPDLRADGQL